MKKPFFLFVALLASALALAPVRVSGMMARTGAEKGKSEERGDDKFNSVEATKTITAAKQIEAAKEAALQGQGNPDLGNNNEVIEEEITTISKENVAFKTSGDVSNASQRQKKSVFETDEENKEENLSDLTTLETRLQEALEVIQLLENRDARSQKLTQDALETLFQEWTERQEHYQEALAAFEKENNNAGLIEQQQNEPVIAKLNELVQVTQTVLYKLEEALPVTATRSNNNGHQALRSLEDSKKLTWRELLDQNKTLFQTPPDKAVFWSGWNGGKDPTLCNLAKAQKYAEQKGKFTLETTEGGKALGKTCEWYGPDTHYREEEANALWRYASEHYLKQVAGHVISFILDKTHPKYNGTSIYNTLERPLLKDKRTIFLSENMRTLPATEFLNERQKRELQKPTSQTILQNVRDWLTKAHRAWSSIDSLEKFTPENRKAFLDNTDVNIRGRKKITEQQEEELDKLNQRLLEDYTLEAKAIVQAWEPLYKGIRALSATLKTDSNEIKEAQKEALSMKASLNRSKNIATLEDWNREHEWLEDALHNLNYYIFKAYHESGDLENARAWKQECLKQEISIDEVPPDHIKAFLDCLNNSSIATPANLQQLARHGVSKLKESTKLKVEDISKEERQLFESLRNDASRMTDKPEDQTQFQRELWQQRLNNLTELHQTLEKNWVGKKNTFEATYQQRLQELEEKEKLLQLLDQEHQAYEKEHDQLYLEGEDLRKTIHSTPLIAHHFEKALEENTQKLRELNERTNHFQAEYPEKRKTLEVACNEAQAALWKMLQEHANEEEEQKLQEEAAAARLKVVKELLNVDEQREIEELRKLHKQTTPRWEDLEKRMQEFLNNNNPSTKEYTKALTQLEAMANEIEAISGKKYKSEKAMMGAAAIRATARALRQWKEIINKFSLGQEEQDFKISLETIYKAQEQTAKNLTRIAPEKLEPIGEELYLSATRSHQIAGWSSSFLKLTKEQSTLKKKISSIKLLSPEQLQPILGATSEMMKLFSGQEKSEPQRESSKEIEELFLAMRKIFLKKGKKFLEELKALEAHQLVIEERQKALAEEKKTLQQEPANPHLQPLLSNIEEQAENVELQKENQDQQEEKIVKAEEKLLTQRVELKKEQEKVQTISQLLTSQNKVELVLKPEPQNTHSELQNIKVLEKKEEEQQKLILEQKEQKNKRTSKTEKETSPAFEIFNEAKKKAEEAVIKATITLIEAIEKQDLSLWELAQEAAQMTAEAWKQAIEETLDHSLLPIAERIQLKRDLPKIQAQQNLWTKKETFAAKKLSALNAHEQAVKETNNPNPTLMAFVATAWHGLLEDHQALLNDHAKAKEIKITNEERQAWEKEGEHLLRHQELMNDLIENFNEKVAQEKEAQKQEQEPLQKETETTLSSFEQLLKDVISLYSWSDSSKWKEYQKKHEHFFEEVERLATHKQEYYQSQPQEAERIRLLECCEQIAVLAKKENEKHQKLELEKPTSEKESELFKINLSILWNQLQEALELEKGDAAIATLWKESRELFEQAATAWNQDKEEKAKLLQNSAQNLGGYQENPGAAYAYQQERRALAQEKQEVASLWKASAKQYQLLADYFSKSMEATLQGDPEKATRSETAAEALWKSGRRLEDATEALKKAIKAEEQGKGDVASLWKASAKQHQLLADYWRQNMEATLQGDPKKATRFEIAAHQAADRSGWRLGDATNALEKAIKAEEQGKGDVASLWKASAKQYQLLADYWHQRMEATLQGDPEKATHFETAANAVWESGSNLEKAIEALEKAIEAETEGKGDVASLWKASAKQYQLLADYWRQSIEATLQEDPEKATRFKAVVKAADQSGWRLKDATEALEKAIEAETQGKGDVASLWKASAKQYQLAADYWRQSIEATLQEDPEKATHFKTTASAALKSGWSLENATKALEKAIKAETEGKGDVVSLWKASAKQYQLLADSWRQSIEATLQEDPEKATHFKTTASAALKSGWSLEDATKALEEAIKAETQGKGDVALLWKARAKQHQLAADCWRQSMEATLQGDPEKATHFETAAEAAKESGWRLKDATEALEEAIKAETQGKGDVASLWKASAKQHQLAADYFSKSMEATLQGNPEKATHFKTAAWAAGKEAEAAEKKAKGQK